jgi:integrase
VTRNRSSITIWLSERREADRGFKEFMDDREAKRIGLPDRSGWLLSYDELVTRFLSEAPLSTDGRRSRLKLVLERNELGLAVGSELTDVSKLTAAALKLIPKRGGSYVVFSIQRSLKQMARWAASVGLLPHDPLHAWRRLPWAGQRNHRRAFLPHEVLAIFRAADDFDAVFGHVFPSEVVFKTLLLTGNRPRAMVGAKVGDLSQGRVMLPAGNGKKRNGMATPPAEFIAELRAYIRVRKAASEAPLLVSHEGKIIDRHNIGRYFKRCMTLAAVRRFWPADASQEITPFDVAHVLYIGKPRALEGGATSDAEKRACHAVQTAETERIAAQIAPEVARS